MKDWLQPSLSYSSLPESILQIKPCQPCNLCVFILPSYSLLQMFERLLSALWVCMCNTHMHIHVHAHVHARARARTHRGREREKQAKYLVLNVYIEAITLAVTIFIWRTIYFLQKPQGSPSHYGHLIPLATHWFRHTLMILSGSLVPLRNLLSTSWYRNIL